MEVPEVLQLFALSYSKDPQGEEYCFISETPNIRGVGVGVGEGVGVEMGVEVGVEIGVGVGLETGVAVGVEVETGVGDGVGVDEKAVSLDITESK